MRHLPLTTKQMMDNSTAFKASFGAAIGLCTVTIVLACLLPYVNCSPSMPCPYYYSYYTEDCFRGNVPYCCNRLYSFCGDSTYCITKPDYFKRCWGLALALDICGGMTVFLAVVVFIMFCNFRRRVNDPMFNPLLRRNLQSIQWFNQFQRLPMVQVPIHYHINPVAPSDQNRHRQNVAVPVRNVEIRRDRGEEPSLLTDAEYHNV